MVKQFEAMQEAWQKYYQKMYGEYYHITSICSVWFEFVTNIHAWFRIIFENVKYINLIIQSQIIHSKCISILNLKLHMSKQELFPHLKAEQSSSDTDSGSMPISSRQALARP